MEMAAVMTKTKYMKAAVCLLLCLTVLSLTLFMDYQEAHAFAPALVLAAYAVPEAVQIVGAVLVAAGLTWTLDAAGQKVSEWFYANCAPTIKQGIADMIGTASNGIATVSTDIWNYARDWVRTNYSVGDNTSTINYHEYPADSGNVPFTADTQTTTPVYSILSITIGGHVYSVTETDNGSNKTVNVTMDGSTKDSNHRK